MFDELVEASKLNLCKGAYQLSYDDINNWVQVVDRRKGLVNYVVTGNDDEMLSATYIYFGIREILPVNI